MNESFMEVWEFTSSAIVIPIILEWIFSSANEKRERYYVAGISAEEKSSCYTNNTTINMSPIENDKTPCKTEKKPNHNTRRTNHTRNKSKHKKR